MKQTLLLFLLLFSGFVMYSQSLERSVIQGQVFSKTNDVESITVYNTSSNKGTITDFDGNFEIEVTLNDQIEISALQFKKITVIIDAEIINNKMLTIFLTEQINTLDEVVILSFGLTGYLETDLNRVKGIKMMPKYWGDLSHLEFDNEHIDRADNHLVKKGQLYNGVDFARIFGLNKMLNKLLSKKKTKLPKWDVVTRPNLLDRYSLTFISESFNIPINQVNAFLAYIELKEFNQHLFDAKNEILLLEFLHQESKQFLKE